MTTKNPAAVLAHRAYTLVLATLITIQCSTSALSEEPAKSIRVATFNASLARNRAGQLIEDLESGNSQAQQVAAIIQRVRPDVLLVNEFDWDANGRAAAIFTQQYLAKSQFGQQAILYPHRFTAPVNTGEPTGLDLNKNGRTSDPQDAHGFGRHRGQYGMLVLSKYPIDSQAVRTFQKFLWRDLPDASLPFDKEGKSYYSEDAIDVLRLSSKSHWDLSISAPCGTLHFLVCHPTPPVFDGPEDRNGKRNQDEIRFWTTYLQPKSSQAIVDDGGQRGGLADTAHFVIAGDLNSDPFDGDSGHTAIRTLIDHPRVNREIHVGGVKTPSSDGGTHFAADQGGVNGTQKGPPEADTADFFDRPPRGSGNLRVDYVLPSATLRLLASGVFWPAPGQPGEAWVGCSDHRLVWIDVAAPTP